MSTEPSTGAPREVVRPNGKVYRPRKAPVVVGFEDDHRGINYVAVLRTHDLEIARSIAAPFRCRYLVIPSEAPQLSWLRYTMRDGEPFYEYDDISGVPCVLFEESDESQAEIDADMARLIAPAVQS